MEIAWIQSHEYATTGTLNWAYQLPGGPSDDEQRSESFEAILEALMSLMQSSEK